MDGRILGVITILSGMVGCTERSAPSAPGLEERIGGDSVEDTPNPAPEEAAGATLEAEPIGGRSIFVVSTAALYRDDSGKKRVEIDGDVVSNYLTTLFRGEEVVLLTTGEAFSYVEASDGTRGFVRTGALLTEPATSATLIEEAKTFRRPSLVALDDRALPGGALLFVLGEKGDFSEVSYAGRRTTWVLSEAVVRDPDAYAVARLLNRVRALREDRSEDHAAEIESLVEVGRASFTDSPLLPALVSEVDPEAGAALAQAMANAKASPKPRASFPLHGSTPTLAWSPDGQRLLMNAAYEYFGFEKEEERDFDELGLFLVDVKTGGMRRIWTEQAYHPVWLSDTQIAWGVSAYEANEGSGLYIATLDGEDTVARRIEQAPENVLNTTPAKGGGVVYFADNWTDPAAWYRYDPREDRMSEIAKGASRTGAAWDPPAPYVSDQCVQSVEDVEVRLDEGVRVRSEAIPDGRLLSSELPHRFEPVAGDCESLAAHCAPILPCVSPDGRHVAFIKGTGTRGELRVELHRL